MRESGVRLPLILHRGFQHRLMCICGLAAVVSSWSFIEFSICVPMATPRLLLILHRRFSTYSRVKIRVQMLVSLSLSSDFHKEANPVYQILEVLVTPLCASGRNCIPKWDPVLRSAPAYTQRQSRDAQAIWRLGHDSSDRSICHLVPDSSDPNSVS